MNVLMLTTHFNVGGITSYILTLSRYLMRLGCSVTVVSSGGQMVDSLKEMGVEHITLDIRTKSDVSPKLLFALPKIRKILKEKQIDVIHSHTRVAQVMAAMLRVVWPGVYVSTCHGFYRRGVGRRLFPSWGDAAIAISPMVRQHLINDHGLPEKQAVLIQNGVDIEQFVPVSAQEKSIYRRQLNFPDGPLIGMVGRFCYVKGQHVAVEAMVSIVEKIPGAKLVLVGTGRSEEEIRKQVNDMGLSGSVFFLDVAVQSGKVYPCFDCFVMPSLQEGLGLALMEAQACGLAVVASRAGGLTGLIIDGQTGLFVEPGNAKQLAEAALRILSDQEFAHALGIRAREFIEHEGSARIMAEKILGVYKMFMKENG